MRPNQREIWLVPVPFTDLSSVKRRPVVIVSSDVFNLTHDDVLVIALTSNLGASLSGVPVTQIDIEVGTLKSDSLILASKVYTLEQNLLIKRFGKLTTACFSRVLAELDKILGR